MPDQEKTTTVNAVDVRGSHAILENQDGTFSVCRVFDNRRNAEGYIPRIAAKRRSESNPVVLSIVSRIFLGIFLAFITLKIYMFMQRPSPYEIDPTNPSILGVASWICLIIYLIMRKKIKKIMSKIDENNHYMIESHYDGSYDVYIVKEAQFEHKKDAEDYIRRSQLDHALTGN